jgi:hypothetical protein
MIVRTTFNISAGARLLPLNPASRRGSFFNIGCGSTVEHLRAFGTLDMDTVLVDRVPRSKQVFPSLLVLELTTPRPCTLKNNILTRTDFRAFVGIWKHCHPIPGTFAHRLRSRGAVLPSVLHD